VASDVLIVEDDRSLAAALSRAIEQMGYVCAVVHDGTAALAEVERKRPDAILLDLLLPKKDGRGVLEALARDDRTRAIPVIAMSGVFRGRDMQAALLKSGARAFLEKPFSMGDLQQALLQHAGRPRREAPAQVDEVDARADLARVCAADVLWCAMSERFSGALNFQHRQRHKMLLLRDGVPVAVRSNLAREALGRRLLAAGRIDERTLHESLRLSKASGRKQGECLVELGAISRSELDRLLVEQAQEKLLEIFAWTAGTAWRQADVAEMGLATELRGWPPQRVMLEGCVRADAEIVQRTLAPFRRCRVERGALQLDVDSAPARALLERLETPASVEELVREFLPVLFALWRMGVVEIEGTPPVVQLPAQPARSTQLQELRARLEEVANLDHFEVLGVARSASAGEVRRAFVEQAKNCHPDKLADADPELRQLGAQLFARLSQAHETLADPKLRDRYVQELTSGKKKADPAAVARIVNAEQLFQRGEGHARRKDWPAAIAALREALQLDAEEGEIHALLGWCTFMADPETPAAQASAIETLRKAIALAPNSPSGYYYLGRLYRICEQLPEAERMFRKILELRPQHAEAAQELRLLERRKSERAGRGLFGLGRKK
jgi:CheY-like chemotaxis protein/curved DNA-binding protein CbpA